MDADLYQLLVNYYQLVFEGSKLVAVNMLDPATAPSYGSVVTDMISKFESIKIMGRKCNSNESVSASGNFIRAYHNTSDQVNELRSAQFCTSSAIRYHWIGWYKQ
jgi:hypothetical protein